MNHNLLPSDRVAIVGLINPVGALGSFSTGWIDMAAFFSVLAMLKTGALGALATVDFKLEQATSSGGAGAKDIAGKAMTQLTKAGSDDNKQVVINLRSEELDIANGFTHARATVTVAVANSVIDVTCFGMDPRARAASLNDLASVKQIVE